MKNFLMFFVIIFCATTLVAQDNKWLTKEEAMEAFSNNIFRSYKPEFLSGHKNLRSGEKTISFDNYSLVKMKIVGGRFWVIQDPGVMFVKNREDRIVRREDCGNDISGFYHLSSPTATSLTSQKSLAFKPEEKSVNIIINNEIPTTPSLPEVEVRTSSFPYLETGIGLVVGSILGYLIFHKSPAPPQPKVVNPPDVNSGGVTKNLQRNFSIGLKFGV